MFIAFFPAFNPDELLYSVVARYGRYDRAPLTIINERLLGNKFARFAYDIPLRIGAFVENVGAQLTARELVERHTLLPYYTALYERSAYERFSEQMIVGQQLHRALKAGHRLTSVDRLRYCPACDDDSRRQYGTAIWLRRHQLPTSLICLDHGGILAESEVDVTGGRELAYRPASTPRTDSRAVAFPWSDRAMTQYRAITAFGHAMLHSQEQPDRWWPAPDLKRMARQKGFTNGVRVDISGLVAEFDHYYEDILQLWPRLQSFEGRKGSHWLRGLIGGRKYRTDPVCWALIVNFLDQADDGRGADRARRVAHKTSAKPPRPKMSEQARAAEDDAGLADKIREVAERLRAEKPPVRITHSNLMRGVPNLYSMLGRYHLPLTRAALAEEAEDHRKFSPRRLRWIFEQATLRGEEIKLTELLDRRIFKDNDQVRAEWHRYYTRDG